jgi:hypothetical protein
MVTGRLSPAQASHMGSKRRSSTGIRLPAGDALAQIQPENLQHLQPARPVPFGSASSSAWNCA